MYNMDLGCQLAAVRVTENFWVARGSALVSQICRGKLRIQTCINTGQVLPQLAEFGHDEPDFCLMVYARRSALQEKLLFCVRGCFVAPFEVTAFSVYTFSPWSEAGTDSFKA